MRNTLRKTLLSLAAAISLAASGQVSPDADSAYVSAIRNEKGSIKLFDGTSLIKGISLPSASEVTIVSEPADGYKLSQIVLHHGKGGYSVVGANDFNLNLYTIPASEVYDSLIIEPTFSEIGYGEETDSEKWELKWHDEFNQPDDALPLSRNWTCPNKAKSAWNRFISNSPEVAHIRGGALRTLCIANNNIDPEGGEMISGAMQSKGKYAFKYGRVECRLKTKKHKGNFPAFWLMPQDNTGGWPTCGEIDIFETIDAQDRSWHTVHSNWTYNLKKTSNPTSSKNVSVSVEDWHIYSLEWTDSELRWFVDGKQVFKYSKKTDDAQALEQGQWPFDKKFYIILNQSVGNGSWASNYDKDFEYETLFDWVRVYQKVGTTTGVNNHFRTESLSPAEAPVAFDLQGRRVARPERGFYIVNGKKRMLK